MNTYIVATKKDLFSQRMYLRDAETESFSSDISDSCSVTAKVANRMIKKLRNKTGFSYSVLDFTKNRGSIRGKKFGI